MSPLLPKREKPRYVLALEVIAESGLPAAQRDVLRVALRYVNPMGELWPSIETLARDAGRSAAHVRRTVRALERAGIWELVGERSRGGIGANGRGITSTWRWGIWNAPNPISGIGLSDGAGAPNPISQREEPDQAQRPTRSGSAPNPIPVIGELSREPSIHEPSKREPSGGGPTEPKARAPAGMYGWGDVRSALRGCGVRGPVLDTLAAMPSLTVEEVRREAEALRGQADVRSRSAVLVSTLAKRHGIKLTSKPPIPAGMVPLQERLEAARRARGFGGGGSGGGGSDSAPLSDLIGGRPPTAHPRDSNCTTGMSGVG